MTVDNLPVRLNCVNKLLLIQFKCVNFMLHITGYPGIIWNKKDQLTNIITIGDWSLHLIISFIHIIMYLIIGILRNHTFTSISAYNLLLSAIILLAKSYFKPTALQGSVNEFINIYKFFQRTLRIANPYKWKHFINFSLNLLSTCGQNLYAINRLKHRRNTLPLIIELNFKLLPDLLLLTAHIGLLTSQALYEYTSAELIKITNQYEHLKYLPLDVKRSSLKKIAAQIRQVTVLYSKIQQVTDKFREYCEFFLLWRFIILLYNSSSSNVLFNSEDVLTIIVLPFVQLLQVAIVADSLETQSKRPLEVINVENLNICHSYDQSDYHVFFMHNPSPNRCLVFDLDTTLPFPTYFHKYVTETFRSDLALRPEHHRFFRVIPAETYLAEFASDRRHMRRPDGSWIKPPPSYPPIQSSSSAHSLGDFICMTAGKGPGTVYSLSEFVQQFYKAPHVVAQQNNK